MNQFFNVICLILGLFYTAFCTVAATALFLIHDPWGHWVQRCWGRGCLALMAIRVQWEHLEDLNGRGAFIFAPNHESAVDILVLATLPYNFKWIAKDEIRRMPFIGWATRAMGCFFVQRNRSDQDLNVMSQVEDGLKAGQSSLFFPEGTRTRTGELLPFKKGAFRTAQNTGVPLVPVGIRGTFAIVPPDSIPRKRNHEVSVRIGVPLYVKPGDDLNEVMNRFKSELLLLRKPLEPRHLPIMQLPASPIK